MKLEKEQLNYHKEKEKAIAEMRDKEAALYYQLQADKEYEMEQLEQAMRNSELDKTSGPAAPSIHRENKPQVNHGYEEAIQPSGKIFMSI